MEQPEHVSCRSCLSVRTFGIAYKAAVAGSSAAGDGVEARCLIDARSARRRGRTW